MTKLQAAKVIELVGAAVQMLLAVVDLKAPPARINEAIEAYNAAARALAEVCE